MATSPQSADRWARAIFRLIALRLAVFAGTVFLIVTLGFLCLYRLPGDPARMILGRQASTEAVLAFRASAGLDQPIYIQYTRFLRRIATARFGDSLAQHRPVAALVLDRLPVSAKLTIGSLLIVLLIGFLLPPFLFLGRSMAPVSAVETLTSALGITPPYVLGVLAIAIFAGALEWIGAIFDPGSFRSWLFPCCVLAAYPTAVVLRLFTQEIRQSLGSAYALRARSLGFSRKYLVFREAVPNSLASATGALGNAVAGFITGSFFVEAIFGIPGVGQLTYQAIQNNDIPLLAALCILFAGSVSLIANAIEVLRFVVNRRVRLNAG